MKTNEEIKKWLLENCVDTYGNLVLEGLDFSDFEGDIFINGMQVKHSLYQHSQLVGGDLDQCCQVVGGDLLQDSQFVRGNIDQSEQFSVSAIFQDHQIAQGSMWQFSQEAGGKLISQVLKDDETWTIVENMAVLTKKENKQ